MRRLAYAFIALVLGGGEFIVHLPLEMARVLADSLPGFSPMKRAAFDTSLVSWRDREAADPQPPSLDPADSDAVWAAALSVAVGDFNGDSTRDVAMEASPATPSPRSSWYLLQNRNRAPRFSIFGRP